MVVITMSMFSVSHSSKEMIDLVLEKIPEVKKECTCILRGPKTLP